MRKIKGSNSYLRDQTRLNLAKAVLCVLIFGIVLFGIMYWSVFNLQIDTISLLGLVFLIVPAIAAYYYLRKYHLYNGGRQGEKRVNRLLGSSLSDDYYLINDLYLQGSRGDIDHILLAPNGIFVLETKNWRGKITCNGDKWHRAGKGDISSSPSRQVKWNVSRIKRIIDNTPTLRTLRIWVEGIVVLTNKHTTLNVNSSTVPILRLDQLLKYIRNHESTTTLSLEQLEALGKEIMKQKA
jgi:hypothetical protein